MLVRGVTVHDDMQIQLLWCLLLNRFEKRQEFPMSMALFTLTNNLTTKHFECRKQSAGSVSLVVMCHRPCTTFLQWKAGLCAIQCLNRTFLINTEDGRVLRWIPIQAHHI